MQEPRSQCSFSLSLFLGFSPWVFLSLCLLLNLSLRICPSDITPYCCFSLELNQCFPVAYFLMVLDFVLLFIITYHS